MKHYEKLLDTARQHVAHIYEIEQRRGIHTSNTDYLEATTWLFEGRIDRDAPWYFCESEDFGIEAWKVVSQQLPEYTPAYFQKLMFDVARQQFRIDLAAEIELITKDGE